MTYLINTRELQYCKMADVLYRNWYNYSEIDTGENVLPIYKEIKETYQRYKTPAPDQKKIEVRKDEIKSFPEIAQETKDAIENFRNSLPEIAQGITKAVERLKGSTDADEKSLMYKNTERNDEQLKDWLSRYERAFIKTYDAMIMPTGHDEKIWMYKNIKPNETRLYGLDIEGIAQVTATEVRTWRFIIDNLPFYETHVFTDKPPQSDFDSDDKTNPLIFDMLENSNLPVIDTSIFDPNFIFDEYHNKAFTCSRFAFNAWMVHGKKCDEKIEWIYKTRDGKINKAKLKMFIDKITNTDTAKEAYFKNVFGIEVNKSDYRNASLAPFFKDLSHISDKKKFLK